MLTEPSYYKHSTRSDGRRQSVDMPAVALEAVLDPHPMDTGSPLQRGRLKWLIFAGLLLAAFIPWQSAQAADCETLGRGLWSNMSNWDCGLVPDGNDSVTISHAITATTAISVNNVSISASSILTAMGDVTVGGDWTDNGTFRPSIGTQVIFNSSTVTQTISGGAGGNSLDFRNVLIANDHTGAGVWVRINTFIEVTGTVTVTTGAALHLAGGDGIVYADVDNDLINNGRLKITKLVAGGGAGQTFPTNSVGYRGVTITSTNNLGDVDVIIDGNAADCTNSAPANYVKRCYTIIPTNPNNSATVRFFALDDEVDPLMLADLEPYRFIFGTGWITLTNVLTGTIPSTTYNWVQGDTTGFSSFLLAPSGEAPTAVRLTSLTASPAVSDDKLMALLLAGLVLLFFTGSFRRRKPG